jgi:hypothetical protein
VEESGRDWRVAGAKVCGSEAKSSKKWTRRLERVYPSWKWVRRTENLAMMWITSQQEVGCVATKRYECSGVPRFQRAGVGADIVTQGCVRVTRLFRTVKLPGHAELGVRFFRVFGSTNTKNCTRKWRTHSKICDSSCTREGDRTDRRRSGGTGVRVNVMYWGTVCGCTLFYIAGS